VPLDTCSGRPEQYGDQVKRLWVHRDIDARAEAVWELLTNPERWPEWGPMVRRAQLDDHRLEAGATGTVTTVLGIGLPFEITDYDDRLRWAWKVAGVGATDHRLEPTGRDHCRVGFGVPWPAAPYLAVCRIALARLQTMAMRQSADS